jgi:hypothetical protein
MVEIFILFINFKNKSEERDKNLIYLDVLCYSIKDDRPSQTAN